ncbi:synaptophysin-like protein 1 [Engraulis encrasicolus]|uniref:synaptophysin-like protein 1 n=1 Tax=Engraulis encrasicolus TaxID=184585 RepID=UPI002FD1276E
MMPGFRLNLAPLKEPLGFIRILEWFTAVFAFGSCGGYSGQNVISLDCTDGDNTTEAVNLTAEFFYPFRLSQGLLIEANTSLCNHTIPETRLIGDAASSVEFFVGVAVMAFLYCMLALVVYLGYMHVYKDSNFGPMLDFLVTASFAFLWLVSSSAWARGLGVVKESVSLEGISGSLGLCDEPQVNCQITEAANTRSLDISVVFGFLNLVVWIGNAWFVYKETQWHSKKAAGQQGRASQAGI